MASFAINELRLGEIVRSVGETSTGNCRRDRLVPGRLIRSHENLICLSVKRH